MNQDMKAIKTAEECDYWFQQAVDARAKMEGMAGAIRGLHETIEKLNSDLEKSRERVTAIGDFCFEAARTHYPVPAGLTMLTLECIRDKTREAFAHVRQENTTPCAKPERPEDFQ